MAGFAEDGIPSNDILARLERAHDGDIDWRSGRAPLFVFSASDEVSRLGQAAFNAYFSENALGARRAFPSLMTMELEVVAKGLDLLHAPDGAAGNMTTGGTESILLAVKTARDFHRHRRGQPGALGNIVAPVTLHPAFDKAAALMDIEIRRVPVSSAFAADVGAMAAEIDDETMMVVGSAPGFSYGVVDPIAELGALARDRDVWLHVDACVGGWIANFVRDIGYPVPDFDFGVEGVRSISADLHKFGFCPKPASTIFFRDAAMQAFQQFAFDAWPSGRFATQTYVGTRPGGAVAGAWAVTNHLGRKGYRKIAADLMAMRGRYLDGLARVPGMTIRGAPHLLNVAFGSDDIDMLKVAALMGERGWLPGTVQRPPSLHLMMSMHHEGAREAYIRDVAECVVAVRAGSATQAAAASYA
jgi:glutamate/tyrosine decarboxylase-like PLP-dependent enzyme